MTRLPGRPTNCPRCGGRLARDNDTGRCAACQTAQRDRLITPPTLPTSFWEHEPIRQALTERHLGRVFRAYRCHPYHGREPLPQRTVAGWLGMTQAQLSRIENGPPIVHLDRLAHWSKILGIPARVLWFKPPASMVGTEGAAAGVSIATDWPESTKIADTGDVTRRELLRILTMASALMGGPAAHSVDWERAGSSTAGSPSPGAGTLRQYEMVNASLWKAYGAAMPKHAAAPMVRQQLGIVTDALRLSNAPDVHRRLCAVVADLLQLTGELAFDAGNHEEAGRCYSLAATACREAQAYDLWACAMTRYAYLSLYQQAYSDAKAMLDAAARLAANGDSQLSTRQWVQSVRAQALARLGQVDECRRALDSAESVSSLTDEVHNGGWLRFNGSRTTEERGNCYVALGRPALAEPVLMEAVSQGLSVRRRGIVMTDLALVGVQRGDVYQAVHFGAAALDAERQGRSGVLKQRLLDLRTELKPFGGDHHVRHLTQQITAAVTTPVAGWKPEEQADDR
ncbi:helix-turn-helix domain-containing protein [Micromonospora sp. NPDC051300]|uniref:helix-turn-helix domain-containing protein n=1 Tax=Micromonospora sp. NPDC051300 TaxID=3364286 RepID=UPI00379400F5